MGRGIDLAIRRNDFDWGRNVQMQPLCAERMGPVCHPDRLAQFFALQSDGGLALRGDATRLHSKTRPKAWEDWWKTPPNQPPTQIRQAQAGVIWCLSIST
jgi:DNA-binding transcriptional LysR family regulator